MPGFLTHYVFGQELLNQLPDISVKKIIQENPNSYALGLQGPDLFFYYFPTLLKGNTHKLGNRMHKEKTHDFLMKALDYVKNSRDSERDIIISYIGGFFCHYTLDTNCHPYIYAKSNHKQYEKDVLRHFAYHSHLETIVDTHIYHHYTNQLPSSMAASSTISLSSKEQDVIANFLCNVLNSVYFNNKYVINCQFIIRAMKSFSFELSLLYDPHGYKKKICSWIDKKILGYPLLSCMIPSDHISQTTDYLNTKHRYWWSPWDDSSHTDSFYDLFEKALYKCNVYLILLDQVDHDPCFSKLDHMIENLSYSTGNLIVETE